jgi:DNA-directed RNA polymerase subunit RPC12/RpoP
MKKIVRAIDVPPIHEEMPIHFIGTRVHGDKRLNQFEFVCSSCGAEGELGVRPNKTELINCPNHCGALFIQLPPRAMFQHPRLIEVTSSQVHKAKKGPQS